jgi:rRNA processing protein Gar1
LGRHKSPSPHRLQLLGEVVRIRQSKAYVRASTVSRLAAKAYNSRGKEVGYVSNIFGRVTEPMVEVKLAEPDSVREGEPLYVERT